MYQLKNFLQMEKLLIVSNTVQVCIKNSAFGQTCDAHQSNHTCLSANGANYVCVSSIWPCSLWCISTVTLLLSWFFRHTTAHDNSLLMWISSIRFSNVCIYLSDYFLEKQTETEWDVICSFIPQMPTTTEAWLDRSQEPGSPLWVVGTQPL